MTVAAEHLLVRAAKPHDVASLAVLVQRAYRGASSAAGWSHEGDLPTGQRIGTETLLDLIALPTARLLIALRDEVAVASVLVEQQKPGSCSISLLSVDPDRQGGGIGDLMLKRAEATAADAFAANRIEIEVLEHKRKLRGYYERRGYDPTQERRPYRHLSPAVDFIVYEKRLGDGIGPAG
jgi:GNAT superfamily N-acetyltransferase